MGGLGLTSQTAVASAAHAAATTTISHRQALQQIHVAAHANLVTSLSGPEVSVLTSNGDSWIADTQALTMSDKAATTMCRMRLLLDVRQGLCRCQRRTAATNDHVLTCPSISKIDRHNAVVHLLAQKLRDVNLSVTVEPFHIGTDSRARPDLLVTAPTPFGAGTVSFATDIVVCHAATSKTGAGKIAMAIADETKFQRWSEWARKGNIKFVPGVISSSGTVSQTFRAWMKDVLHCSGLASEDATEKAHELRIGLGVAVAEATARIFSFCPVAPQQSLQRKEVAEEMFAEEVIMEDEVLEEYR